MFDLAAPSRMRVLKVLAFGISPSSIALQNAEREDDESSRLRSRSSIIQDPVIVDDTQLEERPVEIQPVLTVAEPTARLPLSLLLLLLWARDTAIAKASSIYGRSMCTHIMKQIQRLRRKQTRRVAQSGT
eukprot:8877-Heterococcus_DN1.PRE.2